MTADPNVVNRTAVRVTSAPSRVIGIQDFDGRIFVACEGGVYELKDDELVPLRFLTPEPRQVRLEKPRNWPEGSPV